MDFNAYRAMKALNWSSLKLMHDSPKRYQWGESHPRDDTPSLGLGRWSHVRVLQPELYAETCVHRPPEWDSWRTSASKEWRAEQESAGREVLTDEDAAVVEEIASAVANHRPAMDLLEGTRREESITWEVDGVTCKGRLDAIADDRIVDLKTCRDLGSFARKDAATYLYHGQLAWYLDGAIAAGRCSPDAAAYVIPVESGEPYDCAAMRLGEQSLDAGRALWRRLLSQWQACRAVDHWPGRYPSLTTLDMPGWAPGMRLDDEEEGF